MNMTSIYIFVILGMILMGFVYWLYLRDKFQKAVIGHVWATFRTKTGSRIDTLCKVSGNIVTPPPGLLSDNPKPTTYLVRADITDNFSYPPLFPHSLQATVPSVIYDEGNPEPLGKMGTPPVFSDELLFNLRNESSTGLIMRGMNEALRADDIIEALNNAGGGNKTLLYVSIGLLVGLVILGIFVFQLSGQVGNLLALYGL